MKINKNTHPQTGQYKVSNKSRTKMFLALFAVVALVLAVGATIAIRFANSSRGSSIDLTEHILTPKVTGNNGDGKIDSASVKWNKEGLENALREADKSDEADRSSNNPKHDASKIIDSFTLKADKLDKLSNGDKVTVSIEYRDQEALEKTYGVRFLGSSRDFPVSGLSDLVKKSPFEGVDLKVQGVSPYAELTIDRSNSPSSSNASSDFYELQINGEKAESRQVKIGDEVKIIFNDKGVKSWKEKGLAPSETELVKVINSDEVPSYVRNYSELSRETVSSIERDSNDLMTQTLSSSDNASFKYRGYLFSVPKDDKWKDEDSYTSALYMVYEITKPDAKKPQFGVVAVKGLVNDPHPENQPPSSQNLKSLKYDSKTGYESIEAVRKQYVDSRAFNFQLESTDIQ